MFKKIIILSAFIFTTSYGNEGIMSGDVKYYKNGSGAPVLMIISGIHGDEISGIKAGYELTNHKPPIGTLIIIPEANRYAVENGNRTEYYMEDLNRVFFRQDTGLSSTIARDIVEIIEKYRPEVILDCHESYHPYDENRDPDFYVGNTIIFHEKTMDKVPDLIFQFMEEGYIPLNSAKEGSLAREIPVNMGIPVITIEVSREDTMDVRKEKYRTLFNTTLKYLNME